MRNRLFFKGNSTKSAVNRLVANLTQLEIAENLCLRTGLNHPCQRSFSRRGKRFAQGRFLARARSQHPDLFCGGDGGVAQGYPARRRLGRIFDGQKRGGAIQDFGRRLWKQRRDMAVLAHAEKNQIQPGSAGILAGDAAEFRFGNFDGGFR